MKHKITILMPINFESRAHSEAFKYLESKNIVTVKYLEFSLLKQVVWILRGKENSPLSRVLKNIYGVLTDQSIRTNL
ncbi:hypothetical protein ACFLZE_04785, partial [Thermodesulfobacteriota bacterium]